MPTFQQHQPPFRQAFMTLIDNFVNQSERIADSTAELIAIATADVRGMADFI
jgi:type IV secretory pathway TrbL component